MPKGAKGSRAANRTRTDRVSTSSRSSKASKPSKDSTGSAASKKTAKSSSRKSTTARDRATQAAVQSSDKLYYRIGEVSELTSVKAHVLRYWETEFRWMAPPKSRSKQRLYRKRDIEFVLLLKRLLWDERYTIAGARQRIQDLGVEGALAMLSEPPEPAVGADSVDGAAARSEATGGSAHDWVAFRVAIDEMRDDLLALRGSLQESA